MNICSRKAYIHKLRINSDFRITKESIIFQVSLAEWNKNDKEDHDTVNSEPSACSSDTLIAKSSWFTLWFPRKLNLSEWHGSKREIPPGYDAKDSRFQLREPREGWEEAVRVRERESGGRRGGRDESSRLTRHRGRACLISARRRRCGASAFGPSALSLHPFQAGCNTPP